MTEPSQPVAPIRKVVDNYFGQEIVDPYRWMEEPQNAELAAWLRAQNDYTRRYLDGLPVRAEILQRLEEVIGAVDSVTTVQLRGERYFYLKRAAGENVYKLFMREGLAGMERLLVDPGQIPGSSGSGAITAFSASPDGGMITYLISSGGAEYGDLRVMDAHTGEETGEIIEHTRWDAGAWLPDGQAFAYLRFQELAPGASPIESLQKTRIFVHSLGSSTAEDRPVFGYGVHSEIQLDAKLFSFINMPIGSKYAIAYTNSGVSPNSACYLAPIDALDQTPVPWRQVAGFEDDMALVQVRGDDLYLLTYRDTPRYKITRTRAAYPDLAAAEVVFPPGMAVLENMLAAKDALYVQALDGGIRRLLRLPYGESQPEQVDLPEGSAAEIADGSLEADGVLFFRNSWTRSPALYRYDPHTRSVVDTGLVPPHPVEFSGIETRVVQVPSHDGVAIPLVILSQKDLPRDGANPTRLTGYGAYGLSITSPSFNPFWLPWLERGGVIALAGVRGGGEYGEEWHLAGKEGTKPNTWKDFIACAEYLVREGYTSPACLSGQGKSAGGILINNAYAERPDLFAAAISDVGLTNALRFETTINGVPNIPEFGTVENEAGFQALLAMDAYHKIKEGAAYPAVLFIHGINDPRVEPWLSAKMAARLLAASTSGRPVLLRIDYEAGHGFGGMLTRRQEIDLSADQQAFLLDQMSKT